MGLLPTTKQQARQVAPSLETTSWPELEAVGALPHLAEVAVVEPVLFQQP